MPVAQSDPRQPGHRQHIRVARNDSLKSERSDKRVSFNNDVGIKHIPRGQKENNPRLPKVPKDEWANCVPVNRESPHLSSKELERQAEDLVRLIDQVDCVTATKPIHNPSYTSRSLDRTKNKNKLNSNSRNNAKVLNNSETKNNLVNGGINVILSNNRTTNPIGRNKKESNLYLHRQTTNNNAEERSNSRSSNNEKLSKQYKSVPDIPTTIYYNNTKEPQSKYLYIKDTDSESGNNFMSVDNLYENKGRNYISANHYKNAKNRSEYKSADNLTDISIPGNRKLHEYKPYENLQSGFSSTTDVKTQDMENEYRPKVSNMIRRFNSDSGEPVVRTHPIYLEESSNSNYNNKPFSYTSAPLSSVEEIKRLSPSRDIPINKYNRRARSSSREYDHQSKTTDSDYSAKIIITGNNVHTRHDDDDHAYETYQVGGSPFAKHSKRYGYSSEDLFDGYKNHSNNNMNMSSIGVQTDRLPKPPQRFRKTQNSSTTLRHESYNDKEFRQDLPSASLVRRINHGFGRVDRSPSPPPVKTMSSQRLPRHNVVPLLSDTDDSEFDYHRRMDPLAKIRNQVMIREKLQEEKEAEELEEREAELYERRHKSLINLNTSEMQPLTVDEVDALTLEVDKKGRNTLVVAEEKKSRGRKPTPDPKGSKERSLSPRIFTSTLERLKKSTSDKDKSTLERNKAKDKKKKKIKIKFFYDPRPQDKPNEDPLERFTEYKGSNSDDQENSKQRRESSQDEEYYTEKRGRTTTSKDYHSLSRETNREKELRFRYDSSESPSRGDSSPTRPPRHSSRDRSTENLLERNRNKGRYSRESSAERTLRKDNRFRPSSRSDYDSTFEKRDKKSNKNSYNYLNDKENYDKSVHYNNIRNERSYTKTHNEKNYKYTTQRDTENKGFVKKRNDYNDTDHHDSSDQGHSLSEKYKSLTRRSSPSRERTLPKTIDRPSSRNNTENDDRREKIERQRKKFFGVLLGEGKAKTVTTETSASSQPVPPPPSETKVASSTLPRASQPHRETAYSSTLQRPPKEQPVPIDLPNKTKEKSHESRTYISRDKDADDREKKQWESATLGRSRDRDNREKERQPTPVRGMKTPTLLREKYSAESSPSSTATPTARTGRVTNYKQRYFGDTDTEVPRSKRVISPESYKPPDNYRSLPNRKSRTTGSRQNLAPPRRGMGVRKTSPGARGSAGSSLQSSESEADSHGGSHASKASHVSTGSNRSVYLHATAVADIPVRRSSDEAPSERGISKQSKKVTRSFSLISPWKPRHYREKYEVEYDNKEAREARHTRDNDEDKGVKKNALPPRPPRKGHENSDSAKKVGRSQTVNKDSKLAGWLRRKKNKEAKGI